MRLWLRVVPKWASTVERDKGTLPAIDIHRQVTKVHRQELPVLLSFGGANTHGPSRAAPRSEVMLP